MRVGNATTRLTNLIQPHIYQSNSVTNWPLESRVRSRRLVCGDKVNPEKSLDPLKICGMTVSRSGSGSGSLATWATLALWLSGYWLLASGYSI